MTRLCQGLHLRRGFGAQDGGQTFADSPVPGAVEGLESPRRSFLESLRVRRFSPATRRSYAQSLDLFFRFLIGRGIEDVREVVRRTIRDYQTWLMGRGYTIWTVQARLIALRRFYEHLEKTDAVLLNPCAGLVLPATEKRLPHSVLTRREARAALEAPDTQTRQGIRDRAILEVFYSTGIRLEEMARLSIFDVDTRNGFLRVNQGKFGKDRVVPMGRKACDYVREYLEKIRWEWSKSHRDERALWLSSLNPHRPLKSQVIQVMVRNYGKRAGLMKRLTPHLWRHTCATHLIANGSNIAYVQRLLGHRSLSTTQIYTRVTVPEVQAAWRRAHPRSRNRS